MVTFQLFKSLNAAKFFWRHLTCELSTEKTPNKQPSVVTALRQLLPIRKSLKVTGSISKEQNNSQSVSLLTRETSYQSESQSFYRHLLEGKLRGNSTFNHSSSCLPPPWLTCDSSGGTDISLSLHHTGPNLVSRGLASPQLLPETFVCIWIISPAFPESHGKKQYNANPQNEDGGTGIPTALLELVRQLRTIVMRTA